MDETLLELAFMAAMMRKARLALVARNPPEHAGIHFAYYQARVDELIMKCSSVIKQYAAKRDEQNKASFSGDKKNADVAESVTTPEKENSEADDAASTTKNSKKGKKQDVTEAGVSGAGRAEETE